MRPLPIRPAAAGQTPAALRSKASLRNVCAAALAAAIGFAPAIAIQSPAAAAITGFTFVADSVTASEGGVLHFDIRRTGGAFELPQRTLTWAIVTGAGETAATADDDFVSDSGELNFPLDDNPSSTQTQRISIQGVEDSLDEANETFTLRVSYAGSTMDATGTLTDNDATPTYKLSVSEPTVQEAVTTVEVSADLSAASGREITIPLSTVAGTAKAGQDYTAIAPGDGVTIVIPAGETTASLDTAVGVGILDDLLYEENLQNFIVRGAAGTNVAGTSDVTVNIEDEEERSALSISMGDSVLEGDTETLEVTLDPPSERPVTVDWNTVNGAGPSEVGAEDHGIATAGADYTAAGGTLSFAAETLEKFVKVRTLSDNVDEIEPEDFHVRLSNATIATIETADDTVGILDDPLDVPPTVTVSPIKLAEGNAGNTRVPVTLKLSRASGQQITVDYSIEASAGLTPATPGLDFRAREGTATFAAGETTTTVLIDVFGDRTYEPVDETLTLALDGDAAIVDADGDVEISIDDDDAKPTFTVAPVTMTEGNGGSVALFNVKLSNPTFESVEFDVVTTEGTAKESGGFGEDDYDEPGSVTVTIPAGQVNGYTFFLVNGDEIFEPNETMNVKHTLDAANSDAVVAGTRSADLTLTNDDAAPVLTLASASAVEGSLVDVTGVVQGMAQSDTLLSLTYAGGSVGGSDPAEANDFSVVEPGQVTIGAGTVSGGVVDVPDLKLTDDTVGEAPETIVVSGTGFGGAGTVTSGVITIVDNDQGAPPVAAPTLTAPPFRLGVGSIDVTGTAVAGATVDLWAAPVGGGALAQVDSTTANAQGAFSFTRGFTNRGMRFQVKSGGKASPERTVFLRHDPVLIASSPSKGTATLRVTGDPMIGGLNVIFQQYAGNGQWTKVGVGTTGPSGLVIKNVTGLRTGSSYTFRAYVVGNLNAGLLGGYTGNRKVTVK